jgi:hypothetical protein
MEAVTRPANWDIGADLGSSWDMNFPIQGSLSGLALSDTPD